MRCNHSHVRAQLKYILPIASFLCLIRAIHPLTQSMGLEEPVLRPLTTRTTSINSQSIHKASFTRKFLKIAQVLIKERIESLTPPS